MVIIIPRRFYIRVEFQSFLSQCLICPNGFSDSCGVCGVTANQNKNDSYSSYPRKSNKCQWPSGSPCDDSLDARNLRTFGVLNPLGAGLTHWVDTGVSAPRGGRGGPSSPMVRLRRHHKLRENFFKIKKPNGFTYPTTPALHQQNQCVTIHSTMNQAEPQFVGTVVTGESPLPTWLSVPDPKPPRISKEARALLHVEYEQIFERVVEDVYRGRSLQSLIQDDHRAISYEDFLRWVKRDPTRHERFKEAQEMRTEFLAGEILEIADGIESVDPSSPDTVNRDKLRIDTRKWLMSAHNRKRYGETKQIELGGTVSITEALAQAQARVIEGEVLDVSDVTPRLENRDD